MTVYALETNFRVIYFHVKACAEIFQKCVGGEITTRIV